MTAPVSVRLRQEVAERAAYRCEYCGLPQRFALHAHEPDHIVPRQHGGESHLQNLAWACLRCNQYKGPNVGSFDPEPGKVSAFFQSTHPRLGDPLRLGRSNHPTPDSGTTGHGDAFALQRC
jgi:hypothetical protein